MRAAAADVIACKAFNNADSSKGGNLSSTMNRDTDGFYSAHFSGLEGEGFAVLIFKGNRIVGTDPLGVKFDGTFSFKDDENLSVQIRISAPPNGTLIQGTQTGPVGLYYDVNFDAPVNFTTVDFLRIKTQFGPVNARLKKLRDLDFD